MAGGSGSQASKKEGDGPVQKSRRSDSDEPPDFKRPICMMAGSPGDSLEPILNYECSYSSGPDTQAMAKRGPFGETSSGRVRNCGVCGVTRQRTRNGSSDAAAGSSGMRFSCVRRFSYLIRC